MQFQRYWLWAKRQNHTYRPNRPLTPQEEAQSVSKYSSKPDVHCSIVENWNKPFSIGLNPALPFFQYICGCLLWSGWPIVCNSFHSCIPMQHGQQDVYTPRSSEHIIGHLHILILFNGQKGFWMYHHHYHIPAQIHQSL